MKRETLPSHQTEIRWSISKSLSPSWMIRHSLFRNHFITRASGVWGSFWLVKLMSCLSCVGCDSCVSWAQFTCNHWEKPKICFEQPFDVRTPNAPKTSPCPDITRQKIWRQSKSYAAKALSSPRHNCAKNRQMLFSLPHLCKSAIISLLINHWQFPLLDWLTTLATEPNSLAHNEEVSADVDASLWMATFCWAPERSCIGPIVLKRAIKPHITLLASKEKSQPGTSSNRMKTTN